MHESYFIIDCLTHLPNQPVISHTQVSRSLPSAAPAHQHLHKQPHKWSVACLSKCDVRERVRARSYRPANRSSPKSCYPWLTLTSTRVQTAGAGPGTDKVTFWIISSSWFGLCRPRWTSEEIHSKFNLAVSGDLQISKRVTWTNFGQIISEVSTFPNPQKSKNLETLKGQNPFENSFEAAECQNAVKTEAFCCHRQSLEALLFLQHCIPESKSVPRYCGTKTTRRRDSGQTLQWFWWGLICWGELLNKASRNMLILPFSHLCFHHSWQLMNKSKGFSVFPYLLNVFS